MGTTLTALNTGITRVAYAVLIEGYGYAITDGEPGAVFSAFDTSTLVGHDLTGVHGGLSVDWNMSQLIEPWEPFGESPTLRFAVAPAAGYPTPLDFDQFGITVGKRTGGHETALTQVAAVDCNDLSVPCRHALDFAASGQIFVGNETMNYSSVSGAGTFTISQRGVYSPFQTETPARFAHSHRSTDPSTTTGDPIGVTIPPVVSDEITKWTGRWVGVWILRVVNEVGGIPVYDTTDQGHLAFAGTIASIGHDEAGRTVVELDHVLRRITDTTIHRDPYRAVLADGCAMRVGDSFGASTMRDTAYLEANALVVVSGAPASVNEIQTGRYTVQELAEAINAWLRAEKAAARLHHHMQYVAFFSDPSGGLRARLDYQDPTAGGVFRLAGLSWSSESVAEFMGWDSATTSVAGSVTGSVVSSLTPRRWERETNADRTETIITLENPRGKWWSQNAYLPASIKGSSTTIDGVIKIDGMGVLAARWISDTSIGITRIDGGYFDEYWPPEMLAADSAATLEVTQVVVMESTFANLLLLLLMSTGTQSFNATSYDLLPEEMSCSIPFSLMGADFIADLERLDNSDRAGCLIISKPTKFGDLMKADFMMRWASLVWGQGRLHIRAWTTPLAGYATTTIGESTKAAPADAADKMRASSVEDVSALFNVVKFEYGSDGSGKLRDDITILDKSSARDYGPRTITIEARNAARSGPSAESIVELISSFSGTMGMFSRPYYRITRPIASSHFEQLLPLTVIAYTDPHIRNPETGQRGITAWPALVMGSSFDWGGVSTGVDGSPSVTPTTGEVTLMLRPRIVSGVYSPAMRIDDSVSTGGFSAGYNSGTLAFKVVEHQYSEAANPSDVERFAAGDVINIIEIDPSSAAAPTTWTRTIATVSPTSEFTITVALAAPAWDAAKKYIVTPDNYAACQASQQDKVFQAEDAGGTIEGLRNPFGWSVLGSSQDPTFALSVATTLPSRPTDMASADGAPLDVAYEWQAAELANNMASYKCAPMVPENHDDVRTHSGSTDNLLVDVIIVGFGEGRFPAPLTRKLYFAPHFRSTDGNTATVRATLCRLPPQGDSLNDATLIAPYVQVTYTTTSTTFVTATAQALDMRHLIATPGYLGGMGFLCIECVKGATSNVEYKGPALMRVGPLVSP